MRRWAPVAGFAMIALAGSVSAIGRGPALQGAVGATSECARALLLTFEVTREQRAIRQVQIWRLPSNAAFFFTAGMTVDADGAPNAYNPQNTGLDDIANAGSPAHWDGIITDPSGQPVLQGANDPYPGYYVSCTSLVDRTKNPTDPTRYVDATKIPYVVLPGDLARETGTRLGDFAVVLNRRNGKSSYAIFADVGTMGEGSVALARNLGLDPDARGGGSRQGLLYVLFPGSGNGKPRTRDEINSEGQRLFADWGGAEQADACSAP
jgi:hypothetical protein